VARTRKTVLGENPFSSGTNVTPKPAREAGTPASSAKRKDKAAVGKPVAVSNEKSKSAKVRQTGKGSKPAKAPPKSRSTEDVAPKRSAGKAKPVLPVDVPAPKSPQPPPVTQPAKAVPDNDASASPHRQHLSARIRELESTPDVRAVDDGFARAEVASRPETSGAEGGVFEGARDLLSSEYYLRQWGRIGIRNRSEDIDDFGHDREYDARLQPLLDLVYDRYFRIDVDGAQHVPAEGRALIVANHAGAFPYDGIMLKTAMRRAHPAARDVRWLAEDHWFYMPFLGSFLNRMGAVRACQENAERLLRQERLVAVFPEGAKGTGRLYKNRHKLQRFGRGGFVRLCLRTQTPIIPCVIAGAEESMPLLFRIESLAHLLGVPYIPITPTFPWLGPLGVVPAPTKWQFIFGEPIRFDRHGPGAADDTVLVGRLTERVRATMQVMLDQASASRRSVWFG
jgi:1-acyl-sn-glycerol-3-phosphate acyltransferase